MFGLTETNRALRNITQRNGMERTEYKFYNITG
jgi:hypothetical protein